MAAVRRRLRVCATAWLLVQVVALAALVPRDCCASHRPPAAASTPRCHESAATVQCPKRAADGTPCPMHRHHAPSQDKRSSDDCSIRGTCAGPMAALLAQLSQVTILTDAIRMLPDVAAAPVWASVAGALTGRPSPPDPPPPRA